MTAKLNWGAVGAAIRSAEATGTTVGVAGIAPTGERFGHNAGRRFHSAGQGAPSLPAEWPCPIAGRATPEVNGHGDVRGIAYLSER
jgi:hypothetical protein